LQTGVVAELSPNALLGTHALVRPNDGSNPVYLALSRYKGDRLQMHIGQAVQFQLLTDHAHAPNGLMKDGYRVVGWARPLNQS